MQGVLFEYDILASSSSSGTAPASSKPQRASTAGTKSTAGFQPLTQSGENLIDEVTGILGKARAAAGLGGGDLQDMGKALVADLKAKMGAGGALGAEKTTAAVRSETNPPPPADKHQSKQPANAQDLDPRAKYREKVGYRSTAAAAGVRANLTWYVFCMFVVGVCGQTPLFLLSVFPLAYVPRTARWSRSRKRVTTTSSPSLSPHVTAVCRNSCLFSFLASCD